MSAPLFVVATIVGKPDKATIDAAFADLTPATGKDWLPYYRNQALQAAGTR